MGSNKSQPSRLALIYNSIVIDLLFKSNYNSIESHPRTTSPRSTSSVVSTHASSATKVASSPLPAGLGLNTL